MTSFDARTRISWATTAATRGLAVSTTTTPWRSPAPFTGTANSGVFAAAVATNVKPAIESAIAAAGGTSLYTRITFNAANYTSLSSLTLKMQYDDGYVAYLNGVEIASGNAPASPTWNSLANEEQTSDVQATTYENVNVSRFLNSATTGHLTATGNVLAIQVLMSSNTDGDMLVVPELAQMTRRGGRLHLLHAHAGRPQCGERRPGQRRLQPDGRSLLLSPPGDAHAQRQVSGAQVYYTTNGGEPASSRRSAASPIAARRPR